MQAIAFMRTAARRIRRLRVVDKYLFRRFWIAYLFSILIFMSFFVLIDFLGHLPGYLQNEVPFSTLARYYVCFVPLALGQMSPLGVLLACLSVAGGMAKANEITALRAGGVSPVRAISPLLAGATCVAFLGVMLGELVVPIAALQVFQIKRAELKGVHTALNVTYGDEKGRHIFIGLVDTQRELMEGLHLKDPTRGKDFLVLAEVGIWEEGTWELYWGVMRGYTEGQDESRDYRFAKVGKQGLYELVPLATEEEEKARAMKLDELGALLGAKGKEGKGEFDSYIQKLKEKGEIRLHPQLRIVVQETPGELLQGACEAQAMTYGRLQAYINNLRRTGLEVPRLSAELKAKISFPLANLIVALVGIPFGLRLRWGGMAMGVGAAVGLGLVYHFLTHLSKAMTETILSPGLGAWLPNLIFAAAGIYLLHRASK